MEIPSLQLPKNRVALPERISICIIAGCTKQIHLLELEPYHGNGQEHPLCRSESVWNCGGTEEIVGIKLHRGQEEGSR